MGWVILTAIMVIIGIGMIVFGVPGVRLGGIGVVVLAFLLFFIAGIKTVPVKSVGVLTSFGHVEGQMGPGIHHTWPWKTVTIMDERIQTTTFNGGDCLDIRIGGQQTACLDLTIQWQIKDSAAPQLFRDYDTSGNVGGQITQAVVVRELEAVVNQVMGDYNPIEDVSVTGQAGNSQFSTFGPVVLRTMRRDIGGQINVIRVIMPFAKYDASTQSRLNAIQQQYAETAIASQQIVTNTAQSKANQAVAASVNNSPGVLVQECLQVTQEAIKSGYGLPAGWSCTGSSSLSLAVK